MRQMFFLLAAAMLIAFSLSWASPRENLESHFLVPQEVLLPKQLSADRAEIIAMITLHDTCESIESVSQEQRGHRIIFSIRVKDLSERICLQQTRTHVPVDLAIEKPAPNSSRKIDVYFRENDDKLKYFGSIELKEKLISQLEEGKSFPNM